MAGLSTPSTLTRRARQHSTCRHVHRAWCGGSAACQLMMGTGTSRQLFLYSWPPGTHLLPGATFCGTGSNTVASACQHCAPWISATSCSCSGTAACFLTLHKHMRHAYLYAQQALVTCPLPDLGQQRQQPLHVWHDVLPQPLYDDVDQAKDLQQQCSRRAGCERARCGRPVLIMGE